MRIKVILGIVLAAMMAGRLAVAKQLYGSDFEGDAIGSLPTGWEQIFKGNGEPSVIKDPLDGSNRVLASTSLAKDQARHDVGGSIYAVGEDTWTDYIADYDAYFPEDFYMGVLFRIEGPDSFYLFDRRSAGELGNFDFWHRNNGAWAGIQRAGKFNAEPKKWYHFRLVIQGDTFEAYAAAKEDNVSFDREKPFLVGTNGAIKSGRFGLYGLIYIDNLVIGESVDDLVLAVDPAGRLATRWGAIKDDARRP